ncbi:MAG TPA: carboxypeptidase-like regulatory domain-containing protein, partial [Polyangia bacterium]|nr:carboxypeptidase-like regulatory domain-containing protein [Polyangia bacterium]
SADAIAGAANVTIAGTTRAASGRVSQVVISDSLAQLPALQLPAGAYVVTVEPPAGSSDGLTTFAMTAPGTWSLALKAPVTLAVHVTDNAGNAVVGAKVTATALSGLGAAPTTSTDADGVYQLQVGAGTASNVRVEPLAGDKLSDATVFVAAGATSADVTLGPGLQVAGTVVDANNAPVASVLVEAMCWDCATPTVLTTAVSDASGNYILYLPDPGQRVAVDAGTTGSDGGVN